MPVSRSIDRKSTRLHSSHTEIYTFPYTTLFRSMLRDPRVYEDQRIPFSRNLIVDPRAVDLVHACLPKHRSEEHTSALQSHRDLHLSLHDALPIYAPRSPRVRGPADPLLPQPHSRSARR